MKKFFQMITFVSLGIFVVMPYYSINGQNVVQNGSFEDESAWEIYNGGTPDIVEYIFPYTDEIPSSGSGEACLNFFGTLTTGDWINGLIWQQLELEGGSTYVLDAAWLFIDGDIENGSWFQIYVSEEEPVDGVDWTPIGSTHSDRMFGFNSWSGCSGAFVDGTFMDDACDPNHTALYRVPGETGQTMPVYIGLKTGAGWGGTFFEILVDDISLRPNIIVNGDFEDDSGWIVYDGGAPNAVEVVISNSSGNNPGLGHNNCLYLKGNANGDWCNGLVWQELELVGGEIYAFNAGFRHLKGTLGAGSWIQAYISQEAPVDSVDWTPPGGANSDVLIGFNSWSGCSGDSVDGTFRKYGCDGQNTTLYNAPGNPGDPVTVYFGIKAGCGWGGDSLEITIDDVSLVNVTDLGKPGTSVSDAAESILADFSLHQNFPNPFNPSTTICFVLPNRERVKISVFDVTGREVRTLTNQSFNEGKHSIVWDGSDDQGVLLPSGIYFYRLDAGTFSAIRKLTFLK